jgi:hypothetical protein
MNILAKTKDHCKSCGYNNHATKDCKFERGIRCKSCNKAGQVAKLCKRNKSMKRDEQMKSSDENKKDMKIHKAECKSNIKWLVDSGCSANMCNDVKAFSNLEPEGSIFLNGAFTNQRIQASGKGTVKFEVKDIDDQPVTICLKNVLYVPELNDNLISVKAMSNYGASLEIAKERAILKFGDIEVPVKQRNNLYELHGLYPVESQLEQSHNVWHNRLGHVNSKVISETLKSNGVEYDVTEDEKCEPCGLMKTKKTPFPKESTRKAVLPMERIHVDLTGPFPYDSLPIKHRYAIIIVDEFSRYTYLRTIPNKSSYIVISHIKKFCAMKNCYPKCIRSDRGGEFTSKEFEEFCTDNLIKVERTAPYSPEQNGIAESGFREAYSTARLLLKNSSLNEEFLGYALVHASRIRNVLSRIDGISPHELFLQEKPQLIYLKVFGCVAYVKEEGRLNKFERRAVSVSMLEYLIQAKRMYYSTPKKEKKSLVEMYLLMKISF